MNEKHSLVANAADEKQVANADRISRLKNRTYASDLREVLSTPSGKRIIYRILDSCKSAPLKTYRSSFTGNSDTFRLEGRREIGLELLSDVLSAMTSEEIVSMCNAAIKAEESNA